MLHMTIGVVTLPLCGCYETSPPTLRAHDLGINVAPKFTTMMAMVRSVNFRGISSMYFRLVGGILLL
jgi:hypothetical protein